MIIPEYVKEYAKRHRFGSDKVLSSQMLLDAAEYERNVHLGISDLYSVRMAFVSQYPKTSGIYCRCKKVWNESKEKFIYPCKHICKLSVNSLIQPKFEKRRYVSNKKTKR